MTKTKIILDADVIIHFYKGGCLTLLPISYLHINTLSCQANDIVYLTTIDFLYFAIKRNLMSIDEAHAFVRQVQANDSHLPTVDFNTFVCNKLI